MTLKTRLLLVAACALIDRQNRVLMAQRPQGKTLAGLWEFPGGKVEPGEGPEDAVARELREELAISVERSSLRALTFASHSYPEFHLLMPLFVCRQWAGIPEPMEGQKIAWVDIGDLLRGDTAYAMPPADGPLLAPIGDYLKLATGQS